MDQRVSFITLVVTDLDLTRRFYVDGLGWEPELDVPGEVLMFRVAEKVVLSLWVETGFTAEVGHAPARGGTPRDAGSSAGALSAPIRAKPAMTLTDAASVPT